MTRAATITALVDAFSTTHRLMYRYFASQFANDKLSLAQYKLLFVLDGTKQTPSELAAKLYMTPSAVTQAVEPLVQEGLVDRKHDAHDRRLVHLSLHKKGVKKLEQFNSRRREGMHELTAQLSDEELEALLNIQMKLIEVLEHY